MHHSVLERKQSTIFWHPGRCRITERPGERWVLSKEAQSVALLSPEAMAKTTVWVTDATMMLMDQFRPAVPSWSSRTISQQRLWRIRVHLSNVATARPYPAKAEKGLF